MLLDWLVAMRGGRRMTDKQLAVIRAAIKLVESFYLRNDLNEYERELVESVNSVLEEYMGLGR